MYRFICICIFVKYDITPSLKRRRGSRQEEVTCNNDSLPGLDGRISALIKVELEKNGVYANLSSTTQSREKREICIL